MWNLCLSPLTKYFPPSSTCVSLTCFLPGAHTLFNDLVEHVGMFWCARLIGHCKRIHGNCMNLAQWRGSVPLCDAAALMRVCSCVRYPHCRTFNFLSQPRCVTLSFSFPLLSAKMPELLLACSTKRRPGRSSVR